VARRLHWRQVPKARHWAQGRSSGGRGSLWKLHRETGIPCSRSSVDGFGDLQTKPEAGRAGTLNHP
jgi:hypothetical protein